MLISWAFVVEPPIGIEPMTYALRGARAVAAHALAAPIARATARMALAALELSGGPVHEPVHARDPAPRGILLLYVNVADVHGTASASGQGAREARHGEQPKSLRARTNTRRYARPFWSGGLPSSRRRAG